MTNLRAISRKYARIETHVVFVHGLSGHIERTWTSTSPGSPETWPLWLEEDIPNIGLWLVGFPAAMTYWRGYGISIPDRADSILARLLAEPDLAKGNISFVAHSLGGLVVKQILRNADRQADNDQRAKDFLARVSRVAFLGTPGVAPKLIIINELWDDAWARHLWDRTPVFDMIARAETTRDRIGGFGRASAASEWLVRHAAPIACRSV